MPIPESVQAFWNAYVALVGAIDNSRFFESFAFGDNEELANNLAQLVLSRSKRATTSAVWTFASGDLPEPGCLSIVTDWTGTPLCIIETIRVDSMPFDEVSAEFAALEGEGDGSLDYWRKGHRAFFTRECNRAGRQFSEKMLVVCEQFRVVFPPSMADKT